LTIAARLRRLEAQLAPLEPAITIEQWCQPQGRSCVPPADVRRAVEGQASGCWRVAAWAPDQGCAVLLGDSDELQVVEL
jgi:hypothetical protein